jgi:hypothetical protein
MILGYDKGTEKGIIWGNILLYVARQMDNLETKK